MTDKKISALTDRAAPDGTEQIPVNSAGSNYRVTFSNFDHDTLSNINISVASGISHTASGEYQTVFKGGTISSGYHNHYHDAASGITLASGAVLTSGPCHIPTAAANALTNSGDGDPYHTHSVVAGGLAAPLLTANTDIYIDPTSGDDSTGDGTSGTPWENFTKFQEYARDYSLRTGIALDCIVKDGTHSLSAAWAPTHKYGDQIVIKGQNYYDKNVTSIQSSSGSANNFSVVLNVDSVANIAVNDYAIFNNDAAGGSNPSYLCGCYIVTNVDAVNTRITVLSKHLKAAPSGAVTGTFRVIKTILDFDSSTNGIELLFGKKILLENIVLKGSGSGGSEYGIYAKWGSDVKIGGKVGIVDFQFGFNAQINSTVSMVESAISNCYYGSVVDFGSSADCTDAIFSGCASGVYSAEGSNINAQSSVVTGCTNNGVIVYIGGSGSFDGATITGNGDFGIFCDYNGTVRAYSVTYANNTNGTTAATNGGLIDD